MLRVVTEFVRERIRVRSELLPAGFSWLFVLLVEAARVLILVGSLLQRPHADLPVATVAALLALSPSLLFFLTDVRFLPGLMWTTSGTATVILLFATSTPIVGDLAPALLVVAMGAFTALTPALSGALALCPALALLTAASVMHRLDALVLYLGMAVMAWLMGVLTRLQAALLVRQQELQADLAEHAAADERRRIAREVHDVIAHSLSITLLHVTGARHALQQDRDVDDAVDALTDAERLGRQAMADIRRTVGLLEDGPAGTAPEPNIADIGDLIEDYLQAGLQVVLHADGSSEQVSAAVGLALYRITQESLANIAKHAPDSKATVELAVSPPSARLVIVNEMPVAVAAASRGGRGLAGMRQRVELLGGVIDAGPCAEGWSVRAEIPLADPNPRPSRCPLT